MSRNVHISPPGGAAALRITGVTHLNSPLLLLTRSGAQYLAEVSSTTMWTVLVVLPLLVLTRHSQFPVKPGWMLEMVRALVGSREA